jgi:hypothetical protein
MKKLLIFGLALGLLFSSTAFAQCVPDPSHTTEFLFPLPTAPLPSGEVGTAYAQVITVNVPADTTINLSALIGFPTPPVTVIINTLSLGTINGLPLGIFGANTPGNGIINGGASGCIDISGTPLNSGQYVVNIPTTLNVIIPSGVPVIGGTAQNIPGQVPYNMEVTNVVAVNPAIANGFSVEQSLPNPSTGMTVVRFQVSDVSDVTMEVLNLTGAVVYRSSQKAVTGAHSFRFDVSDFAPGMYLYRLSDGKDQVVRKMLVQ